MYCVAVRDVSSASLFFLWCPPDRLYMHKALYEGFDYIEVRVTVVGKTNIHRGN